MFDKVLLATDLSEEADGLLPCFTACVLMTIPRLR